MDDSTKNVCKIVDNKRSKDKSSHYTSLNKIRLNHFNYLKHHCIESVSFDC